MYVHNRADGIIDLSKKGKLQDVSLITVSLASHYFLVLYSVPTPHAPTRTVHLRLLRMGSEISINYAKF